MWTNPLEQGEEKGWKSGNRYQSFSRRATPEGNFQSEDEQHKSRKLKGRDQRRGG